jgi:glycosyltransferase involved in cell wall biosynthesis
MVNKIHVILVGPIPAPVGGVSSHVFGLARMCADAGIDCTILDAYPNNEKAAAPEGVNVRQFNGVFRFIKLWLFLLLRASQDTDIIHFHFSNLIGKLLFFPLLVTKKKQKFILTIHHGNQQDRFNASHALLRWLAVKTLNRMNRIIALSTQQASFYHSLSRSKLPVLYLSAPPILPRIFDNSIPPLTGALGEIFPIESSGDFTILMTSGYPHHYYRFEYCVELLEGFSKLFPCKLIVSLYGNGNDSRYEAQLRNTLSKNRDIVVVGPLSPLHFSQLLAKASVYLRPSLIDSYGLTINEALNLGVPCIASDACERDPRCEVFSKDNYSEFFERSLALAQHGRTLKTRIVKMGDPYKTERRRILEIYHGKL